MNKQIVKKIIPVDNNLSLKDCQKVLMVGDSALGVLDSNREITSYVLAKHIERALKFDIADLPIRLIATKCNNYNLEIKESNKQDYFIGNDKQDIEYIVVANKEQEIFVNLKAQYEKNINPSLKKIISLCSEAAEKINLPIYLIGGIVRDIILDKETFDIDITVEENAIKFAEYLEKTYQGLCFVKEIHDDFKTAKVLFKIDNQDITIDIASTRTEIYAYPASLPVVKSIACRLEEDIVRRDFTVNSMAMSLNKNSFGHLIDYLGGYEDLRNKILRILHPLSFIDDPTRIIRALKFAVRFDLEPNEVTQTLQLEALSSGLFDNLLGERIKSEIKQTLNLNKAECYDKLLSDETYRLLFQGINPVSHILPKGEKIEKIISKNIEHIKNKELIWLVYLGCLFAEMNSDEVSMVIRSLNLNSIETKILLSGNAILKNKKKLLSMNTMFEVYEFFECHFTESILMALAVTNDDTIIYYIEKYLNELQFETINTTGKTLIEKGFEPSPEFGIILRDILKEKINGNIKSSDDEDVFLEKLKEKV